MSGDLPEEDNLSDTLGNGTTTPATMYGEE